jgi:hypothetical protein
MKITLDSIKRYIWEDLEDYKLGRARIPKIEIRCTCGERHSKKSDHGLVFRRIIFLYSAGTRKIGSSILRTLVPAALIDSCMHKDTKVILFENHKWSECTKGDVVVLSKSSINAISDSMIYEMKRKGVVIVFDPLDGILNLEKIRSSDYLFASSNNQHDFFTSLGLDSFFIPHVVDPRINLAKREVSKREFSCGYIGDPMNISGSARKIMSTNLVDTRQFQFSLSKVPKWISDASLFSHHYCGRDKLLRNVYKPLTKGFLAARMDACIIASVKDTEYTKYLGTAYPYLIESARSSELREMIEYAQVTYGTSTYETAMLSNVTLRRESCDINIRNLYLNAFCKMTSR